MNQNPDQFQFVFNCRQEGIPFLLDQCQEYINKNAEQSSVEPALLSKIKWVLTELLTNAVKHSETAECMLSMSWENGQLVIEKQDAGLPLTLYNPANETQITWPLNPDKIIEDFQIYHNGMDSLRVNIENDNLATFYTEELPESHMPALLLDTSEHFGLLIITKASDAFIYQYIHEGNLNKFQVRFNVNT